ncbi:MAG: tetratricopeptide repeat protein [Nitrosopumilus sp.]|nr:tetratricopeptide repeat protein [Nitrosopumilus sp.]MDA7944140.1 tetratricopeptide repeat protein [Nitrosopumilus sp.]MDA7999460.1 tetratricopeptide repeat protein [Nitrosopumilus sp.]
MPHGNQRLGRRGAARGASAELSAGAIYDVLHRLEDELSMEASHERYDIEEIVEGIAHSYDIRGSHDSAQTVPLMRDYIRDPRKYAAVKSCAPDEPRLDIGTVYTARLLAQTGRCAEALELADENVAKWPGESGPWLTRAWALHGLGRQDEALACAERALEIRPENVVAAGFKARILAGMGRYEEALEYAGSYRHFNVRHFRAGMGLAHAGLGKSKEAVRHLNISIRNDANPEELEEARRAVTGASGMEDGVAVPGR